MKQQMNLPLCMTFRNELLDILMCFQHYDGKV